MESKIFQKLTPVSDSNNSLPLYWTMEKGTKERLFSQNRRKSTFISKEAGKSRKTVASEFDAKAIQAAITEGENIIRKWETWERLNDLKRKSQIVQETPEESKDETSCSVLNDSNRE